MSSFAALHLQPATTSSTAGWCPPPELVAELKSAQEIGAIGPAALEEHIEHARGFAGALSALTSGNRVLDLGSGGGLPGLVVAYARPDLLVTLLDGRTERAARLLGVVSRLQLTERVDVFGERAEVFGRSAHRSTFDAVVARGFGPPAVAAECAAPLLRPGAVLIVSEPPGSDGSRWLARPLRELGLELSHLEQAEPYRYAVLRMATQCPERYPRRTGVPAKHPLF